MEILVHFLDSNGTRTSRACFANASNHLQLVTINPHAPQSVTYNGNTYTFLGWSTDSGATEADYVAGDTISLTGDSTLYAVYREEHGTISYVDKAAPYDPYPVFSGDTVYRLSNGKGVPLGYSNDENKVIFSMDIAWGELVFTYTDEAGWDNPETNCVTVENTGNGQFTVTYAYVTDRTDITGSLRDEAGDPVTQLVLASGEEVTVRLLLEGEPAKVLENTKIGSLKLTIE